MNSFLADLRFSLRRLWGAPGFAVATIVMLALGIGLSVMMYCSVNGVLLRGLPFPNGDRVVMVIADNPAQGTPRASLTTVEAEDLARGVSGFDVLAYFMGSGVNVLDAGHPRPISSQYVGPGFFEALGLKPLLGRTLNAEDVRLNRQVAVLSYGEWQRSFGGDPHVVGRRLDLVGDAPVEIVGVMPPEIATFTSDAGLWTPLREDILPGGARRLDQRIVRMVGRLHAGVSVRQADAALAAREAALQQAHGIAGKEGGWHLRAWPLLDLLVGDTRAALWGALALALAVLLIACANVAILADARHVARRSEFALMLAIGAVRSRLQRGMLLDLLLLALVAVALGAALAGFGVSMLRELARGSVPRVDGIDLDWRVLGFAAVLGVAAPLIAALGGGLRVHGAPGEALRGGARSLVGAGSRHRALPAFAMALSTIGLVAALGLGVGLWRLQRLDPGFHSDHVHALQLFRESMSTDSGAAGPPEWAEFAQSVEERLAALPGARAVALTTDAPLSGIGAERVGVQSADAADVAPAWVALRRVSADYRSLLAIPLLAGRDFGADDRAGTESVAIVNQALAHRLFGDASPLGRTVRLPLSRKGLATCRIVGVVADIRNDGLRLPPVPEILVSFLQHPRVAMTFLVRGSAGIAGLDRQMAQALWSVDPRQAITRQFLLSDDLATELRPARFFARVVGAFALAAVLLAALGVYAVASLQQRRRIGEFGLRLAIGASPRALAAAVLRDSLAGSASGVIAGLCAVWLMLRRIDLSRLGVAYAAPWSVVTIGLAAMCTVALAAALLPAWRAARVPPMEALRHE